ncbi:MAG TPA: tRNA (guanosine(46)-N7)-methyltransferase TrmB [Myxococcales bacterium]|nr:tRNA (guanosine(46)-N7)-methyltransferase TrmB [Myxococcales bacterium]
MLQGCSLPSDAFPDWERDFGRQAPLEVEVGPGRGAFALDHARLHPERDLLAIESRRSDCELIRGRAERRGLRNLLVIHGDAKLLLPRFFREGQLAAVHVQFPDPWWKTRHHKRRMIDVELAALFRKLLAQGGEVDFRTDVPAYFREASQTWLDAGFVQLPDAAPEVLSTRERRYAVTGQPVFRARYANPSVAEPAIATDRTGRDWRDLRRK